MITELRRELRVSDDEHRKLLNNVHNDDIIRRIRLKNSGFTTMNLMLHVILVYLSNNMDNRDWRQGGGNQIVRQSLDVLPSPSFSASRKKQKTFQSVRLLVFNFSS